MRIPLYRIKYFHIHRVSVLFRSGTFSIKQTQKIILSEIHEMQFLKTKKLLRTKKMCVNAFCFVIFSLSLLHFKSMD